MPYDLTEEQAMFADSLAGWLKRHHGFEQFRADDPKASRHWAQFAEMGWTAALIGEEFGGLGWGVAEMAQLARAFGAALVREPWMSSALLAPRLIELAGTASQQAKYLPRIAEGALRSAFAWAETETRHDPMPRLRLIERQGQAVLEGRKILVLDAPLAELYLVTAVDEAGATVVALVAPDAAGLSANSYRTVDDRLASDLTFSATPILGILGQVPLAPTILSQVMDEARLYLCAEGVGAMRRLLSVTVDYLKTRRQFGQNLSEFQALRHKVVELRVLVETSDALLGEALREMAAAPQEAATAVSAAKVQVGLAAQALGRGAVQLHGGMGMTDELSVGHYFKRLLMVEMLFGDIEWHRRRYAQLR